MSLTVSLGDFEPGHLELLARWLEEPHISRWFPNPRGDLERAAHPPPGSCQAMILCGDQAVGYMRWQKVTRELLDSIGLFEIPENSVDADIFIGAEGVGKGVGPAALRVLAERLRQDPSVPLIGLTSELENERAHRAFEKAGFRKARTYREPKLGECYLLLLRLREPDVTA